MDKLIQTDNMTIGQRAVAEIRARAKQDNVSVKEVMCSMYIDSANTSKWERGLNDPGATFLSQMLLAGFDIQYILIGDRSDGKAVYTECDKGYPPL